MREIKFRVQNEVGNWVYFTDNFTSSLNPQINNLVLKLVFFRIVWHIIYQLFASFWYYIRSISLFWNRNPFIHIFYSGLCAKNHG